MPRKQKKVVIDDRFKKALDKKSEFNAISKFDKTGKKRSLQTRKQGSISNVSMGNSL